MCRWEIKMFVAGEWNMDIVHTQIGWQNQRWRWRVRRRLICIWSLSRLRLRLRLVLVLMRHLEPLVIFTKL